MLADSTFPDRPEPPWPRQITPHTRRDIPAHGRGDETQVGQIDRFDATSRATNTGGSAGGNAILPNAADAPSGQIRIKLSNAWATVIDIGRPVTGRSTAAAKCALALPSPIDPISANDRSFEDPQHDPSR